MEHETQPARGLSYSSTDDSLTWVTPSRGKMCTEWPHLPPSDCFTSECWLIAIYLWVSENEA